MIPRPAIRLARVLYKATPLRTVRQAGFSIFCRLMRNRRVRATINGSTFDLDLGEIIDLSLYLEQYELDVAAALCRYCRPGMRVMDIGANIGVHTLAMGRLVGPGGAVYAFEPTDYAFEKLRRNVSLNEVPHIHLFQAALSDRTAARQMIGYRSSWRTTGGRKDAPTCVDFVRLDDWCDRNAVADVGLIKIDIDGNEFGALAGGVRLLERSRPIMVMEAVWPHFADDTRNPFLLLHSLGYRFANAKTAHEYADISELKAVLPAGDEAMTTSLNVVATPVG